MSGYQAQILNPRNEDDAQKLICAWRALRQQLNLSTLASDPDWFFSVLDWLSPPHHALYFLLLTRSVPVAIVPIEKRALRIGMLKLLSCGFIQQATAPANTGMLVDEQQPGIWSEIVDRLLKKESACHCLSLHGLAAESTAVTYLSAMVKSSGRIIERSSIAQYYIDTSCGLGSYLQSRRPQHRRNLKVARRKLVKLGAVTNSTYPEHMPRDTAMQSTRAIDARSWRMTQPADVQKNAYLLSYIQNLLDGYPLPEPHWFKFLNLDGKPIAAHYSFAYNNVLYAIKNSFDEDYKDTSPGLLLLQSVIETAFHRRIERIEFLAHNWYIGRLATHTRHISRNLIFFPHLSGRLMATILSMLRRLRPLQQSSC